MPRPGSRLRESLFGQASQTGDDAPSSSASTPDSAKELGRCEERGDVGVENKEHRDEQAGLKREAVEHIDADMWLQTSIGKAPLPRAVKPHPPDMPAE